MEKEQEESGAREGKNNQADKLPNFFIVGAARSGTTSLYHPRKPTLQTA